MARGLRHLAAFRAVLTCPDWGREQVVAGQNAALRRLIDHAYANVPYYRDLFDRCGVDPRRIRTVEDLARVPVTTKDDIRGEPLQRVLARGVDPRRLVSVKTSGSVGEPFTVRFTTAEGNLLMWSWVRPMHYFGRKARDRLAAVVYCRQQPSPTRLLYTRLRNALGVYPTAYIDMVMRPDEVLRALRTYHPGIIAGYPGVLLRVADQATGRDRRAIQPHLIMVGGEVLTEAARGRIGSAFGAPVHNCYASEEFALIGWECRETGDLHTCDGHLVVEVLRHGRRVPPGEQGELIATSLYSYAMPFIRYRLGDVVTRGLDRCSCGMPFSTIRGLRGRTVDYFPLPDGRLLHPYEIVRVMHEVADWIRYHRLIQERRDRIVLRVVPWGNPSSQAVERLEEAVQLLLGPGVRFQVMIVPGIEPEPSGKFPYASTRVGD